MEISFYGRVTRAFNVCICIYIYVYICVCVYIYITKIPLYNSVTLAFMDQCMYVCIYMYMYITKIPFYTSVTRAFMNPKLAKGRKGPATYVCMYVCMCI